MKNRFVGFFSLFFLLTFCIPCTAVAESAKSKFMKSTAMLIAYPDPSVKIEDGSIKFTMCTALAYAKNGKKYRFFTAAHCVGDYDEKTSKTVLSKNEFYLVLEKNSKGLVYKSEVLKIGEISDDLKDFAILEAEIDEDIPIVPFSKSRPKLDEDVRIVTAPIGPKIGLLQIRGYISKEKVNDIKSTETKAGEMFVLQVQGLGSGKGSSGGGVFSVIQNAIVGIVITTFSNTNGHISLSITPIDKFNDFNKEYLQEEQATLKKEEKK